MSTQQKIDLARRELLDMGLRSNPLLNYRSNAKSLDVFDEVSEQVFDILVNQNKAMRFLPIPDRYVKDGKDEGQGAAEDSPLPSLLDHLVLEGSDDTLTGGVLVSANSRLK